MRTLANEVETDQLAATLVPLLRPGDVLALNGMLGAGKTRFVQGVARALGVQGEVTSPTFTIHAVHEGEDITLNHFDLYRLEDMSELDDIGYWDVLEGSGVSFIEWAEKFSHADPSDFIELRFTVGDNDIRTVKARAYGARAHRLLCLWANVPEAEWEKTDRF